MLRLAGSLIHPRHEHHDMPEGEYTTGEPLGVIMWLHILFMVFAFGIVFPTGMVLGLRRSKWHVPTQILGAAFSTVGYFLGHAHKGRQYPAHNIHSRFANWVMLLAAIQVGAGVILKLHIDKGFLGKIRQVLVKAHFIVALIFPVVSWVQMVFGAITIPGFCHEDHLGQCLAHEIMGSSFVAYGFFLCAMLFVGQRWLEKRNRSQEFYDSTIITLWGIVNTFTEHRWGQSWSHKDFEHTSMGIIWWAAGLVGIYTSWDRRHNRPRRNHIPALVMIFTGYAMANHGQHLEVSAKVHTFFGYMLMAAGVVRIIEISFVLKDQPHDNANIRNFQFLTPFLLIESGVLFMGATEEQMQFLNDFGIMHGAYILTISSVAFILFLLIAVLSSLYVQLGSSGKEVDENAYRPTPAYQPAGTTAANANDDQSAGQPGIELEPFLSDDDDDATLHPGHHHA